MQEVLQRADSTTDIDSDSEPTEAAPRQVPIQSEPDIDDPYQDTNVLPDGPRPITHILGDVDEVLNAQSQGTPLPPHHRCVAHQVNLIATTDIKKLEAEGTNPYYNKTREPAMERATKLWNKQGKSDIFAQQVVEKMNRLFDVPGGPRWNAESDAIDYLDNALQTNSGVINELCIKARIPIFRVQDIQFIHEYNKVKE